MRQHCSRREIIYVAVGFALSMVHGILCFVYFAGLVAFLRQGMVGCVKGLLILTTRGILSTAIAAPLSGLVGMEKWALIFLFSFAIFYLQKDHAPPVTVLRLKIFLFVFVLYTIVTAMLTSSYPITSAFKSISYVIPFYAIVVAVSITNRFFNWTRYLHNLLTPIILLGAIAFTSDRFNYVSGDFQGAINHPNLFGVVGALYVVVTLYTMTHHRETVGKKELILVCLTFAMLYESASRTGMFSAAIALVIYLFTLPRRTKRNMLIVGLVLLYVACAVFVFQPAVFEDLATDVNDFIYKRETDDVLDSRRGQIEMFYDKFESSPLFGTGFVVPFIKGYTNYGLSFDLHYEVGNLALAVLGDCGIIGSIIFWSYLLYIFAHTKRYKWVLFFIPIILSFGEMAFFATNNIAIYYYVLYGVCLAIINKEEPTHASEYYRAGLQRKALSRAMH